MDFFDTRSPHHCSGYNDAKCCRLAIHLSHKWWCRDSPVTLSLEPNLTGADRSAIIAIIGGGTTIEIRITQQGVTEDGETPENHSVIRAKNVEGDIGNVTIVRAMAWYWDREEDVDRSFTLAEAPFQNNGFTLQLSNDIPESLLGRLYTEYMPNNVVISDKNARILGDFGLNAFDSNGDRIGGFSFVDRISENEGYYAFWLYVDRNVTIRGTDRGVRRLGKLGRKLGLKFKKRLEHCL